MGRRPSARYRGGLTFSGVSGVGPGAVVLVVSGVVKEAEIFEVVRKALGKNRAVFFDRDIGPCRRSTGENAKIEFLLPHSSEVAIQAERRKI
mmetsp:Transcript_5809/g.7309  ORF Transcript_5809/g.7309 Transcript_5809/m.7309 type:complete len:92 (-) Transcript_5809:227-502(-)